MAQDDLDDKVRPAGSGPPDNAAESAALEALKASVRDRLLRSPGDAEATRRRPERSAAGARQCVSSHSAARLKS